MTKFRFRISEVKNQFKPSWKYFFFRVCIIGYIGEGLLLLILFDNFWQFSKPNFRQLDTLPIKKTSKFSINYIAFRQKSTLKGYSRTLVMLFYNSKYVFISEMALANFSVSYWDPNAENIPCYVKEQFSNIHLWQCRLWSFKLEYIKIDSLHKSELI